jgi:hypothetical protein
MTPNENEHSTRAQADLKPGKVQFSRIDYTKSQQGRFYANHVASNATLFEVRLVLSDVDVAGDGLSAVSTMTVLMSPELAQVALLSLTNTLETYTKSFGGTRLPEGAIRFRQEPEGGIPAEGRQDASSDALNNSD